MPDGEIVKTASRAQKELGRLRPHPPARRIGGHARHHHRDHPQAARHSGGHFGRHLPVPERQGGLRRGHHDDPVRHPGRAHRVARRECRCGRSTCHSKLTLPESPLLLLEFHGSVASVKEQAERFGEIAAEFAGGPFDWATKAEDRSKLWQARHDAYWAGARPAARRSESVATDVCVPISRLAECVDETKRDIERDRADRADRRPCRRRQLPCSTACEHRMIRRRSKPAKPSSTGWSSGRSPWRAPAPASMASVRRR